MYALHSFMHDNETVNDWLDALTLGMNMPARQTMPDYFQDKSMA